MNNIGFILIQLSNTLDHDLILRTIKQVENYNTRGQTIIFNSFCDKTELYNLPLLHLSKAQFFYGKLFLFDLAGIILTNRFPNITQRILYTQSAPWRDQPNTFYHEWEALYQNTNLDILVNTPHLYQLYDTCWKKPIGISETFSYEQIKNYI